MAFSKSMALVAAVLVLLPMITLAVDWPAVPPVIADEICRQVECGKGSCSFDSSEPLGYTCECNDGWKRSGNDTENDDLKFLPCVIPECTLSYEGCQAPPPALNYTEVPRNLSAFDPCYWTYCGEGTCVKNSTYLYSPQCECNSGADNLLNITVFPCYRECSLNSDCTKLGIKVANSTSSTDGNGTSRATEFLPGKFQLMTIAVSLGMILWK